MKFALLALTAFLGFCAPTAVARSPNLAAPASDRLQQETAATVTVDLRQPGRRIPGDFLGLSYEAGALADDDLDARNEVLVKLLTNLGTGSLRFGGASVEYAFWSRSPRPRTQLQRTIVTPQNLDRLFAFSKRTGWRVILGLNLANADAAANADEAAYAAGRAGAQLTAFEIGNEPDIYSSISKLRAPPWGYQQYKRDFEKQAAAVRARVPQAPLAGPATALTGGPTPWFAQFMQDEGRSLVLATQHIYPMTARPGAQRSAQRSARDSASYPSITNMLSRRLMARVATQVSGLARITAAHDLPLRIAETNSASGGGQDGVSNVFAAALWGADYAFTLAESGADGLNFHTIFPCRGYTPICRSGGTDVVQPLYYGMLLFHAATPGRLVPVSVQSPANVTAHAVLGNDGGLALVLINKDPSATVRARIAGVGNYRGGTVMRLSGQSLDSAAGITLGGAAVGSDGRWRAARLENIVPGRDGFAVTVPAASALVARLRR